MQSSAKPNYFRSHRLLTKSDAYRNVLNQCRQLTKKSGVHSVITMNAAGFHYIDNIDTVRCDTCELEVSDWTVDMKPFTIHAQRSPTCPFVCSLLPTERITATTTINMSQAMSTSNDEERQKIETTEENCQPYVFSEVETLKEIRRRTFSHWPRRTVPSTSQMIEAGFFSCNVGDRVICLYCNIICQQWTSEDDPCELHKTLSPQCPFINTILLSSQASLKPIINENSTNNDTKISANDKIMEFDQLVSTAACHIAYREIPKRYASFATWPDENLPCVDDLVRAGFFYTGAKTIVTCFYCNGSLQNWGAKDNPMIEHARWFPHCSYVKQLCGDTDYRRIQESKQYQKKRNQKNESNDRSGTTFDASYGGRLTIPDENTLSRLVAARLDLPVSQRMLDLKFTITIIKRCWEDQLRLKRNDFISDADLLVACKILENQIKYIDGKKENILIPNVVMKRFREREQSDISTHELTISQSTSNDTDAEMSSSSSSSESNTCEISTDVPIPDTIKQTDTASHNVNNHDQKAADDTSSSSANSCALCLTEEKCLACIPCGHVATCVPCGHSLKSCPICRSEIKAFVRVYF